MAGINCCANAVTRAVQFLIIMDELEFKKKIIGFFVYCSKSLKDKDRSKFNE
jgi:hypothetical protein